MISRSYRMRPSLAARTRLRHSPICGLGHLGNPFAIMMIAAAQQQQAAAAAAAKKKQEEEEARKRAEEEENRKREQEEQQLQLLIKQQEAAMRAAAEAGVVRGAEAVNKASQPQEEGKKILGMEPKTLALVGAAAGGALLLLNR